MANADTTVSNIFTAAQIVQTVDYTTVTTTADGFDNKTFDYSVGNIFRIQLDHTVHTSGSPYVVPVPVNMPSGYQWTVIIVQDASSPGYVRFPIIGTSNVPAITFPTGSIVQYGTAIGQITVITSIFDSTSGKFLGSVPMIYG